MDLIFLLLFWFGMYMLFKRARLASKNTFRGVDNQNNPDIFKFIGRIIKKIRQNTIKYKNVKTVSQDSSQSNFLNNIFMQPSKKTISMAVGLILLLVLALNVLIVIPAGETGVQSLFGKVKDKELSSGLHIINPLVDVNRMSIRTEEYTMSVTHGEGQRTGADQISALTNEGLPIDLDITVFYHLQEDKASNVYRELGLNFQEKIIRPEIRSTIREVVARYNAKDVYSEKRAEVSLEIQKRMEQTINPRGIIVEQVLLRNVTLPAKLSASISEKLQAEQDAQKYDFVLKKEEKEAQRKRIEAEGQRDAQKTINQSLTPQYLQYMYIKELKDRQGTIYVPTGNNGLPLFKSVQ